MTRGRRSLLLLAPMVALAACQQADVGQPCNIQLASAPTPSELWSGGGGVPTCDATARPCGGAYVEFNNTDCENLVCILSPAPSDSPYAARTGGYCSKACVSNRDCYDSSTGLVCRNIILDQSFLSYLDKLDPETKARYLGEVQFSNYCSVP